VPSSLPHHWEVRTIADPEWHARATNGDQSKPSQNRYPATANPNMVAMIARISIGFFIKVRQSGHFIWSIPNGKPPSYPKERRHSTVTNVSRGSKQAPP
jgi:hypothetical protein